MANDLVEVKNVLSLQCALTRGYQYVTILDLRTYFLFAQVRVLRLRVTRLSRKFDKNLWLRSDDVVLGVRSLKNLSAVSRGFRKENNVP